MTVSSVGAATPYVVPNSNINVKGITPKEKETLGVATKTVIAGASTAVAGGGVALLLGRGLGISYKDMLKDSAVIKAIGVYGIIGSVGYLGIRALKNIIAQRNK